MLAVQSVDLTCVTHNISNPNVHNLEDFLMCAFFPLSLSFLYKPSSLSLTQTKTQSPHTMLLPVKLSLSFSAVTHSTIFSLWCVTVQMGIIRELYSHLINDIMNWVSACVCECCVFICFVSGCVCFPSYSHILLRINVDASLSESHWSCLSGLSQQKYI